MILKTLIFIIYKLFVEIKCIKIVSQNKIINKIRIINIIIDFTLSFKKSIKLLNRVFKFLIIKILNYNNNYTYTLICIYIYI